MKFWCIPVRSISLLSLVSLTLWYVKLKDEALHNLVLGCCCLEELILNECEGISMPTISSSSLKSIEIYCHCEKIAFTIEAVNLEIFHGSGFIAFFHFDLSSYRRLRELWFNETDIHNWWLEDIVLKLPVLECLSLCECGFLDNVKFRSQQLKSLTIERNGTENFDATVDSPNLICFEYEGYLSRNFSLSSEDLLEAEIKLYKPKIMIWTGTSICLTFSRLLIALSI